MLAHKYPVSRGVFLVRPVCHQHVDAALLQLALEIHLILRKPLSVVTATDVFMSTVLCRIGLTVQTYYSCQYPLCWPSGARKHDALLAQLYLRKSGKMKPILQSSVPLSC